MTKIAINGSSKQINEMLKVMENVLLQSSVTGERDYVLSVKIEDEISWDFDSSISNCLTTLYND